MTRLVAIIAFWCGFDALFYWLNRRRKRIITFHNVLPDELFRRGVANGVSNSVSEYKQILALCAKRYKLSTDLMDPSTLTITFDDGYHNQYEYAFKILRDLYGCGAYLFVSGGTRTGALLIDKLLIWVSEVPFRYVKGGDRLRMWCDDIWPHFLSDVDKRGQTVFDELNAVYAYEKILKTLPEKYKQERLTGISMLELDEMRSAGWKIGWHTKSHYPLSKLPLNDIEEELTSDAEMKSTCLSYPYGETQCVNLNVVAIAKRLGYPCAVSNTITAGTMHGRHFLPRMGLSSDKYLLDFELSGFKHFLKTRRLLP